MKKGDITLKYTDGEFPAYMVSEKDTTSAVIVIEEIWGLNDHIKDVAEKVAMLGYTVLAPELLSETGVLGRISPEIFKEMANPDTRDEAQKKMREATAPLYAPDFGEKAVSKLQACYDLLKSEGMDKIAVIGFCFGGTYSYAFATHNPELNACIAFYGQPPLGKVANIQCPVLSFYGEEDQRLMESLPQLKEEMAKYNKDFTYKVYKGAGHAFFNDTNTMRYHPDAAKDSWKLTVELLREKLA